MVVWRAVGYEERGGSAFGRFEEVRGRYVAEDAGTGEGGFHQMRPARAERSLSPAQRLTRRVRGVARRNVTRNGIGVDYFQPSEAAHACQS